MESLNVIGANLILDESKMVVNKEYIIKELEMFKEIVDRYNSSSPAEAVAAAAATAAAATAAAATAATAEKKTLK